MERELDPGRTELAEEILRRHRAMLQVRLGPGAIRDIPSVATTLRTVASIERRWTAEETHLGGPKPLFRRPPAQRRPNRPVVTGLPVESVPHELARQEDEEGYAFEQAEAPNTHPDEGRDLRFSPVLSMQDNTANGDVMVTAPNMESESSVEQAENPLFEELPQAERPNPGNTSAEIVPELVMAAPEKETPPEITHHVPPAAHSPGAATAGSAGASTPREHQVRQARSNENIFIDGAVEPRSVFSEPDRSLASRPVQEFAKPAPAQARSPEHHPSQHSELHGSEHSEPHDGELILSPQSLSGMPYQAQPRTKKQPATSVEFSAPGWMDMHERLELTEVRQPFAPLEDQGQTSGFREQPATPMSHATAVSAQPATNTILVRETHASEPDRLSSPGGVVLLSSQPAATQDLGGRARYPAGHFQGGEAEENGPARVGSRFANPASRESIDQRRVEAEVQTRIDEIATQVLRKFAHDVALEAERRGLDRWDF